MLTIKQITDNTEEVIRGLEKKHFKDAKATIEQVLAFNDKRRSTQNQLDKNLAEVNSLSKSIGHTVVRNIRNGVKQVGHVFLCFVHFCL